MMRKTIRNLCMAFIIVNYALFVALTVEIESVPWLKMTLPSTSLESDLSDIVQETTTRITEAYRAASSIISGAGSETLALANFIVGQNGKIPHSTAIKQASAFIRYSRVYGVPLDVAVAVANTESHFNPDAKSSHGSAGVMQVTWKIHKDTLLFHGFKEESDLHDPTLGIKAGCIVLSGYISSNKTLKTALGRYYGGSPEIYWRRVSRNIKKYDIYEKNRQSLN
ncbi:MAG: hypothetical protein EOM02_04335 [Synergistales bacterium]|nr:hypothetical protein [Synergistales bacterium]